MTQSQAESPFIPIAPNPFIVGNPVRDRAMFFGREAEFELVRKRFQDSDHGMLLVFCGERRSGKTSILFQILDRRLGPDFIPVLIDMQSMAIGSEVEFLARLSQEVIAALGTEAIGIAPPVFREGASHSATFLRFMEDALRLRGQKKIILLFDEYELFESKIDSGLLAEDVLHVLAGLMESQPVFLIFTGSEHLEQRRRDYWKILGKSLYKRISFLEHDDALNLMRRPVEGRVHYDEGVVEAIYRLAAGQAFYTQAICQSLVDQLNDRSTHEATRELLTRVVDGIVNNPLPQMIFLWDGLERDEKLVLALLAECLPEEGSFASVDGVIRHFRKREYPLDLEKAGIATAMEKLFKVDMLLRSDRATLPEYAFRMDLWRLWIRRQHSVWQVMREEGLEIRKGGKGWRSGRRRLAVGVAGAMLVTAALVLPRLFDQSPPEAPAGSAPVPAGPTAFLLLDAVPVEALISLEGRRVGLGTFHDRIAAGRAQRFRITAPGFADTEWVVTAAVGDSMVRMIALRERLGDLRIETQPAAAAVSIDGHPRGQSPVVVRGLGAGRPHRVDVVLAGFGATQREVALRPDTLTAIQLTLAAGSADVLVTAEPTDSDIRVDGVRRGPPPVHLANLALGPHVFAASHAGYLTAETTLVVTPATGPVYLRLVSEPPGTLVVLGDRPARMIYIDDLLVKENLPNSGPRELAPGTHKVHVILLTGETIDKLVAVASRERTTFDFSQDRITRRPEGGH